MNWLNENGNPQKKTVNEYIEKNYGRSKQFLFQSVIHEILLKIIFLVK